MRYTRFIALVLAATLFCSFCTKEPETIIIDKEVIGEAKTPGAISASKSKIEVEAIASKATFDITSEQGWTMMENNSDWLTISPKSADKGGTTTVTIALTRNETYSNRSTEFLFYTLDNEVKVSLTHKGKPAPEHCCELNHSSVTFSANTYQATEIEVTTFNEDIVVTTTGSFDSFSEPIVSTIPASDKYAFTVCPSSINIYEKREATVTFTGAQSGKTQSLTISQANLYQPVHGFPASWRIDKNIFTTTNTAGKCWIDYGYAYAVEAQGKDKSIISAGSGGSKSKPKFSIYSQTLAVSNLTTDDYLLFCAPVTSVAAGTDFDFMVTLDATSGKAPKYWIFEYYDAGQWRSVEQDLKVMPEDGQTKYSFYVKNFSTANHTTFVQSFTITEPIENDFVKMRCRVVGRVNGEGGTLYANESAQIYFPRFTYSSCRLCCYNDVPAIKETKKVLHLGNSFTYYYATAWMFKQIARSQGHQLRSRINVMGSQTFGNHLSLELSKALVKEGGYDIALLQDTSYGSADFYRDGCDPNDSRLANTITLSNNVRSNSANCNIVLESTWAHPKSDGLYKGYGNYDNFADHLINGSLAMLRMVPEINCISPIGVAFRAAHNEGIPLLHTDSFHQNRNGAYLKSCVNYLMLYGEPFNDSVPDCEVDATTAKRLREIAEQTVLGNQQKYTK